jgi:hypothetical protein
MSKARDLANAGTALGAVTATELAYVDGVTSAIQTQLNAKQAVVSGVNDTEIGYLDGVTSAIQAQIDSKITGSSAISPTIVDAKGDIIAATAADTVARLAVGSNNTVLTADSAEATGLKWSAPAGAAPFLVQKVVNNWYGVQGGTGAGYSPVQNTTYFIPVYLNAGTYDRLRIRCSGNSGTSIDFRVGIYNSSSTTGLPTTVVLDAGLLNTESTGNYDKTISQTLTSGFYYLAVNKQGNDPYGQQYASYTNFSLNEGPSPAGVGFMNDGSWNFNNSLSFPRVASVTGAFGTVSSISSYGGNAPWIMIRLAS